MTPSFLNEVQNAGWRIEKVAKTHVVGGCPTHNCNLTVSLVPGAPLPIVGDNCRTGVLGPVIDDYDNARIRLRARRVALGLSIKDIEDISGFAADHLPKFEKDKPYRIPNMQTFIDWSNSLGLRLVITRTDEKNSKEYPFDSFGSFVRRETNAQKMIEILGGAGFSLHLRSSALSARAIRIICDTRDKVERRARRAEIEEDRRKEVG